MRNRFLALILLAATGFGLVAASQVGDAQPDRGMFTPSFPCHSIATMLEKSGDAGECRPAQDHDRSNCCDTGCRHACRATAIVAGGAAVDLVALGGRVLGEDVRAGMPLFVRAVEHIPLA
jgi:hypothetical protein